MAYGNTVSTGLTSFIGPPDISGNPIARGTGTKIAVGWIGAGATSQSVTMVGDIQKKGADEDGPRKEGAKVRRILDVGEGLKPGPKRLEQDPLTDKDRAEIAARKAAKRPAPAHRKPITTGKPVRKNTGRKYTGDKATGAKPAARRSAGDKPAGANPAPRKPASEKASGGDRAPAGDKAQNGERAPASEKAPAGGSTSSAKKGGGASTTGSGTPS